MRLSRLLFLCLVLIHAATAAANPRLLVEGEFLQKYSKTSECSGITLLFDGSVPYDYRVKVWPGYGVDKYRLLYRGEEIASGEMGWLWSPTRLVPKICNAVKDHANQETP